VLGNFEDKPVLDSLHFQRIENGWNFSLELDIHHSTDDLHEKLDTCEICPFLEEAVLATSEKAALRVCPKQDFKILVDNMQ
jgi:hypothetical protein